MTRLRLGLGLQPYADDGVSNQAPTDIAWAGSHTVAEDAVLGTLVGGALSFVDPDAGESGVFTLVDDANGLFGIGGDGASIRVTGVLDYETATSHNITVRFTDSGGLTYDEVFVVTVTDVSESPGENPPPGDGDVIVDDPGNFDNPPVVTTIDSGIAFHGKKKTGVQGKFIYDIGAATASTVYTMQYDPDWSLLANGGVTAMVAFGLKDGNSFRLSGLKGDGSSGLKAYELSGSGGSGWSQGTGHTAVDGGAAQHGTQAGPNWLQIEVSEDGSTYTLRTSADGDTWADEFTDVVPSPHADVTSVPSFGIAVLLEAADAGPFRVDITLWTEQATSSEVLGAVGANFVSRTTTGNISITDAGLGGATPKLAIFFNNRSTNAFKADTADFNVMIGATDGTGQFAVMAGGTDNNASAGGSYGLNGRDDHCWIMASTLGAIAESATFTSWQADGININQDDAGAAAFKAQAAFLAHADLTVQVGVVTPTTIGTNVSLGFQPDAIILISNCNIINGTAVTTRSQMCVGFAAWDGGGNISEAFACTAEDTGTTRLYRNGVGTDACHAQPNNTADSYDYKVNVTRDATSFTATSDLTVGTDEIGYIAIKIANGSARVGTWALPTGTGSASKTGVGIAPGFVFLAGTDLTAAGIGAGTTFGFAVMAEDIASIVASRVSDGAASGAGNPSDERTVMDTSGLYGLLGNGGADFDIDFTSLDADGWTVNVVDAPAAAYLWPYLALSR